MIGTRTIGVTLLSAAVFIGNVYWEFLRLSLSLFIPFRGNREAIEASALNYAAAAGKRKEKEKMISLWGGMRRGEGRAGGLLLSLFPPFPDGLSHFMLFLQEKKMKALEKIERACE